jgi:N-acetylmuramoyl-L-alanine amidase
MKYVIISDGHGKNTPGKRSAIFEQDTVIGGRRFKKGEFFRENEFNMSVADYLEALCRQSGWEVVQLAPEHEDIPLRTRLAREHIYYRDAIRKGKHPILIDIHANAVDDNGYVSWSRANGIETYYHKGSKNGHRLASLIQRELTQGTGLRDRGVKDQSFFMTRETKSVSVLVEYGFMTNQQELSLLVSDHYRRLVAELTYLGIKKYYS